jgi:hypothetical protein
MVITKDLADFAIFLANSVNADISNVALFTRIRSGAIHAGTAVKEIGVWIDAVPVTSNFTGFALIDAHAVFAKPVVFAVCSCVGPLTISGGTAVRGVHEGIDTLATAFDEIRRAYAGTAFAVLVGAAKFAVVGRNAISRGSAMVSVRLRINAITAAFDLRANTGRRHRRSGAGAC